MRARRDRNRTFPILKATRGGGWVPSVLCGADCVAIGADWAGVGVSAVDGCRPHLCAIGGLQGLERTSYHMQTKLANLQSHNDFDEEK